MKIGDVDSTTKALVRGIGHMSREVEASYQFMQNYMAGFVMDVKAVLKDLRDAEAESCVQPGDQPQIYCHKCRRTRQGQPVRGRYSSCPRCGTKVVVR